MSRASQIAADLNKFLGTQAVTMGNSPALEVGYQSTGILPIDVALGGGLAVNRYVTLTGSYSTLKSYIGLTTMRETQRRGGIAAIIDTEHAYDPSWAEDIGVDTSQLIVWPNPDDDEHHTGEEAIDVADALIRNQIDTLVFDSIAATLPQQEATKRLHKETVQPGRQAALMSLAFRRLTAINKRTAILMINQLREQIGVTFGPTEKAPGGRAAGFYSSIIANIRPAGKLTTSQKQFTGEKYQDTKSVYGQTYKIVVEKSKLSRPWSEVYFDWRLDKNEVDLIKFLFSQGVDMGLVEQRGTMWDFEGMTVRGKDAFLRALSDNPEASLSLENQVRKAHGLPLLGVPVRDRKSVARSSSKSSSATAAARTQGRVPAKSATTGRTPKPLRK